MQQWFKLSDPAMEEALHYVPAFRDFAGLFHWDKHIPSESSILRFRHPLERHKLAEKILATVNALLQSAPTHQWYFGMKAHIGVDADSGLVHGVRGTSGNVNDVVEQTVCCTCKKLPW